MIRKCEAVIVVLILTVFFLMCFLTMDIYADDLIAEKDYNDNTALGISSEATRPILRGTTSRKVLVSENKGTKYNKGKTRKIIYDIKIYKYYIKAEHSTQWHYNYEEYHWSFDGYEKVNGKWKKTLSDSGIDRIHNDPQSLMEYYKKHSL